MNIRHQLSCVLEYGLRAHFGDALGKALGDVIDYYPSVGLSREALIAKREIDGNEIETAIGSSQVDGGTLLRIRSNTIASALIGELDAVTRWATIGYEWCQTIHDGGWSGTVSEWVAIRSNPEKYSEWVIALKEFRGQISDQRLTEMTAG